MGHPSRLAASPTPEPYVLPQPALVVLVASAYAVFPSGLRLPILAHVAASTTHPELYEVGLVQHADGCWTLAEVAADDVELELVEAL